MNKNIIEEEIKIFLTQGGVVVGVRGVTVVNSSYLLLLLPLLLVIMIEVFPPTPPPVFVA